MTRVGFTGSREGMSDRQAEAVAALLGRWEVESAHHGCCVGADTEFAAIASRNGCHVVGYPSNLVGLTSKAAVLLCHELRPPKPPLYRNWDIVNATDVLIATPRTAAEELRSGTWATVRYARKVGRPVHVVMPDGTLLSEGQP
jgi:hypothetical protein